MATAHFTWQDALQMPLETKRYEAIGGELYLIPGPSRDHQWASHMLAVVFHRLLVEQGYGEVYAAPFGLEFPETQEGVQPDLVFVSNERLGIVGEDWIRGAPDIVVEILSKSTADRDRGVKKMLYERQGVAEYWIVDPVARDVEVWRFTEGASRPRRYIDRVPVRVDGELVGDLDLTTVFRAN